MFSRYNRTLLQKVYTIENWKAWLLEIKEKKKKKTKQKKRKTQAMEEKIEMWNTLYMCERTKM